MIILEIMGHTNMVKLNYFIQGYTSINVIKVFKKKKSVQN